jgi:Mce-associated membrane protein
VTPAPQVGPGPGATADSRARTQVRVLAGLAVLLLVAVVVLALLVQRNRSHRAALTSARADAVAAARQAIVNLDSLSVTTVDADLKRVLDGATGQFKDQFGKSQDDLKAVIQRLKTVSEGRVVASAVIRNGVESADVLVAVDRTIKDTGNPSGVIANDRWKVTLEKHSGRWLVSALDAVS